jgi:hypothetical protein
MDEVRFCVLINIVAHSVDHLHDLLQRDPGSLHFAIMLLLLLASLYSL